MSTLTEAAHALMLAEQSRTGDKTHEHLGDVQVNCTDCGGAGVILLNPPFGGRTSCDACRGRGYVWQERPLEPEEYQAEIDRLRAKLGRYETTLQLIASQSNTSTARACIDAARAALDSDGSLEGTG